MTEQKINISHDHNFKNILIDFPEDTLKFVFPEALREWGTIKKITFVRQEPKKHHLSDANLALDMPILFEFHNESLLLWLVEFQDDKEKFSIYKLMRYTIDLMELHPGAVVVPAVLFTDRKNWRTDVLKRLESRMERRTFVLFEYIFCKLFDFHAKDYYTVDNPVVKILLPKMSYDISERAEVIRQAYKGLFQLATIGLFEKYIYFIDTYAQVTPEEQTVLCQELMASKETAMLADYIKDIGRKEGIEKGFKKGLKEGIEKGDREGQKKGEYKMMISLIRNAAKKGIPLETIAQFATLDITLVQKIIDNENSDNTLINIPLHLLDD